MCIILFFRQTVIHVTYDYLEQRAQEKKVYFVI